MKKTNNINLDGVENIFLHTDDEYKGMDALYALTRDLFATLKELDYGSEKWNKVWAKYSEAFKTLHGYRPHWAR